MQSKKIGDICLFVTSGGTPSTRHPEYYGGNIPWLKTQEINFNFIESTETYITESGLKNSSAKFIPANSVLVAMYGATAAKVAINKIPLTTNQACCNLIINPDLADYRYVYYYLSSKYEELRSLAVGAAQQNLNSIIIKNFSIDLPNLLTQKRIADILSAFDEKIELNRKMIQTLEAMAQAIFKEWFVDFNFPGATGELVPSPLGPIPKGWRVGNLGEVADVIDCLHSKKPDRQVKKTDRQLLQLWNILDSGHINLSNPYWISESDYARWISRIEAREGIIVITNVGRTGVAARIPEKTQVALGRNMTAIRVKKSFPYNIFMILLLTSNFMRNEIALRTDVGTILDSLNVRNIPQLRFVVPANEIVLLFEQIVTPIWQLIDRNMVESLRLSLVRDSFLSKLMCGEIEV